MLNLWCLWQSLYCIVRLSRLFAEFFPFLLPVACIWFETSCSSFLGLQQWRFDCVVSAVVLSLFILDCLVVDILLCRSSMITSSSFIYSLLDTHTDPYEAYTSLKRSFTRIDSLARTKYRPPSSAYYHEPSITGNTYSDRTHCHDNFKVNEFHQKPPHTQTYTKEFLIFWIILRSCHTNKVKDQMSLHLEIV